MKRRFMMTAMATVMAITICGCGSTQKKEEKVSSALDPKKPVTVTVWNYYNGDQLTAFDNLVEEFNSTVGEEKGIVVVGVSQGDINTLAESLLDSVEGKAGAEVTPTLAAVYSETAYILDQQKALAPINSYFTQDELSQYIDNFLEEGRFHENDDLMLFPISKSTEVFTANETDWADFAKATGITTESLQTQEDLVAAAEQYYEWTDSLTPKKPEDGKALYGRDSVGNYIYVGAKQLGHEMFTVENGKANVDLDRDTFKKLWDNYYIPFINGYFGAYANFRSEDAKTGKILSLTSSTSSMSYLPTEVTLDDDSTHAITMSAMKALPFADAVEDTVVQQGASFCLLKSTEGQQQGAVEFLKWFTDPAQNMDFSISSGYSPVTKEANTPEAIKDAYQGDTETSQGQIGLEALTISADVYSNSKPYAQKPFEGSKDIRSLLDSSMKNIAVTDRTAVEKAIKKGKTREEAVAPYITDAYFDKWFEDLSAEITKIVG